MMPPCFPQQNPPIWTRINLSGLDPRTALRHVMTMKIVIQPQVPDNRVLDMTPNGEFVRPPPRPWFDRMIGWALGLAGLTVAILTIGLVLWFTLLLLPFLLLAGVIGYLALRWYIFRRRASR